MLTFVKAAFAITACLLASTLASALAEAQELSWPRDLNIASGVLTTYQPQVDKLEGDMLSFRAAVAYKDAAGSAPLWACSR